MGYLRLLLKTLLLFLVISNIVESHRDYWKKKHGLYKIHNKHAKHHVKNFQRIQSHAFDAISKGDAKLQGHLSHRNKNRPFHDKRNDIHLQDLSYNRNHHHDGHQQIVLPRPISTHRPDTTPHHRRKSGHLEHAKAHRPHVHVINPILPKTPEVKTRKRYHKKLGYAKKYGKYYKYGKNKHSKKNKRGKRKHARKY